MLRESRLVGSRFLTVIFTVFKCVFMLISTPKYRYKVNPLFLQPLSCILTSNSAMDHCAILKLDAHRLVVQLHQKPRDRYTRMSIQTRVLSRSLSFESICCRSSTLSHGYFTWLTSLLRCTCILCRKREKEATSDEVYLLSFKSRDQILFFFNAWPIENSCYLNTINSSHIGDEACLGNNWI